MVEGWARKFCPFQVFSLQFSGGAEPNGDDQIRLLFGLGGSQRTVLACFDAQQFMLAERVVRLWHCNVNRLYYKSR